MLLQRGINVPEKIKITKKEVEELYDITDDHQEEKKVVPKSDMDIEIEEVDAKLEEEFN